MAKTGGYKLAVLKEKVTVGIEVEGAGKIPKKTIEAQNG